MCVNRQRRPAQIQDLHLTGVMIGAQQGIRIGINSPMDLAVVVWKVIGKP